VELCPTPSRRGRKKEKERDCAGRDYLPRRDSEGKKKRGSVRLILRGKKPD